MATYSIRQDSENGVTYIEVDGSIQPTDLKAFMQSDPFVRRSNNIFCDITRATFSNISTPELIKLVRELKPLTRAGVRGAYIVRKGVDVGMVNMFKVYAEQLQYQPVMETFTDKERALRWLLGDEAKS